MPELAEVEYYRQRWNPGLGASIQSVRLRPTKRIFRGLNANTLRTTLPGSTLLRSEAHGKQMLFQFSNNLWLGLHLGMTGELRAENHTFQPGKHDHFVLYTPGRALVFTDPRQFGRIRFHRGAAQPPWWLGLPAPLTSRKFTATRMQAFLDRHRKLSLKPALLLQSGFPGLGNWMVDEILWRSGLHPRTRAGRITAAQARTLWRTIRFVCRAALKSVARGYSALPKGWLFHERWSRKGRCPRHRRTLARETVGGRTTAWCRACQRAQG